MGPVGVNTALDFTLQKTNDTDPGDQAMLEPRDASVELGVHEAVLLFLLFLPSSAVG